MWDLWPTKWHWDRFFYLHLFPLSAPFHQCSVLILTYMLLTRTTARPPNIQINIALPDNRGSFDIHVTTLSFRLSLLGVQPGMRVHSEPPRRPEPTDAELHRVKARYRALTLQHLQAVIIHSNALFLSAIPQLRHARPCRLPPGAVNMIPVLVTSRPHYRMQVKTSGSGPPLFQQTVIQQRWISIGTYLVMSAEQRKHTPTCTGVSGRDSCPAPYSTVLNRAVPKFDQWLNHSAQNLLPSQQQKD